MGLEICAKCGLPKDLCVCEQIGKEEQRIKIRTEKRKWGRDVTVISGLDKKEVNIDDLTSKLKASCACGGTYKNDQIELQGTHKDKVKDLLISWGFSEDKIDIR
ncbi:MAG: stress response translation initiation inhibitor YciH [Candidatus Odinarchaeota archaeon]